MDRNTVLTSLSREIRDFCRVAQFQTSHYKNIATRAANRKIVDRFDGAVLFCVSIDAIEAETYLNIRHAADLIICNLDILRKMNDKVWGSGDEEQAIIDSIGDTITKLEMTATDLIRPKARIINAK